MSALKYIERLQRMDQLIRMKATGTSDEFAEKMGISRSVLMDSIRDLRELGCEIVYCPVSQNYYYESEGRFHIGFLKSERHKIRGGLIFSNFFQQSENTGHMFQMFILH